MRILIVKLSSLGDVVHAMPAIQDIRRALPGAQIDWVVERSLVPLVRCCAGVSHIIACELRRWRNFPFSAQTRQDWRAFKTELQLDAYDAVIDLQGLTKSALVSRLARLTPNGRRYAMANQTDGSGYEAPTRWLADVAISVPPHSHAVARSRALCAHALAYQVPDLLSFGLLPPASAVPAAIQTTVPAQRAVVALVHGSSRADKQWPLAHWRALAQRLNASGYTVALPQGNTAEQQNAQDIASAVANVIVWPRLELDALSAALCECAGVVGVDSGLSHIAVALDLLHVQIYNFDTAWRTGPQVGARQCSVFAQPTPAVDAVWQAWLMVSAGAAASNVTAPL